VKESLNDGCSLFDIVETLYVGLDGSDCIVDGPWALRRLNASRVSISIFYNRTLAYVKAAYVPTNAGAKYAAALTNGTQLWKYGHVSPYETGGDEAVQLLRKTASLAEPPPIYATEVRDPLTLGLHRLLEQVAHGAD